MSRRPLVLIPAYPRLRAGRVTRWSDEAVALPAPYVDAIRRAGGQELIVLPMGIDAEAAAHLMARVDGLLLIGGGDVAPERYGADGEHAAYGVSPDRDAAEVALSRAAEDAGVPTLAICRGAQVLAVAHGGALDPHITGRPGLGDHGRPGVADGASRQHVVVTPGSRLAGALGTTRATVACHHHQAVLQPGHGLGAVATSPDGLIEAIEPIDPTAPWTVGVQWHPEDTAGVEPVQQRLFDHFVGVVLATSRSRDG
jgi:putative glutamine amidotransferase